MRAGLRTEIILSISLLLAAALLFAGFLLLKLTERNLLDQQRAHAASVIRLLAAGVDAPPSDNRGRKNPWLEVSNLNRLQAIISEQPDILAWRLLDAEMQVLSSTAYQPDNDFPLIPPSTMAKGELYEELSYDSFHFFNNSEDPNFLELSMPLWAGNDPYGLLQIRFSLEGLLQRVWASQKLVLIYVVLYGLILAAFGVYLLNRNVVKPVRQLHLATKNVAEGSLNTAVISSGPGEISDLAESFNRMVDALSESRAETSEHIESLEHANCELAQARDDLVRSEKLATVGHLAAGMAHEIGNPLGAVVGYLNILKEDIQGESRDLVERSLSETARIDRLIRELLDYSAPASQASESFCPVLLLRETVEMLRHQGQLEAVDLVDQCRLDNCVVSMDRNSLMQVWINLLLNAQDAASAEGQIELSSERHGSSVCISIADDGSGIAPDVIRRIFEPFFTTKAPGSGYGLGLAVCQRIVDENGGTIEVDSEEGRGTRFIVTLPCSTMETV